MRSLRSGKEESGGAFQIRLPQFVGGREKAAKILSMMEDNKQLALRIDGAVQSASQEVTNLRAELTATNRRLAELSGGGGPGPGPAAATSASAAAADSAAANMENHQLGAQGVNAFVPPSSKGCFLWNDSQRELGLCRLVQGGGVE
ncbi:Hypothetical predicted protein [Marmota monax]|uniref:Uncharacterized protein n=1 Tax=Marmota monax TaxID=9995 RepID=A0A5E4A085_MARMO|nr:hypothetical protein GHT09_011027 [Marmota monax]VTJ50623.1 Hypothetical predicted protein [Marmota monax]